MKHLTAVSVLILAFATWTSAQDGICPNIDRGENCYFEDVASLTPSGANANQFFVIGGLFDVHSKGSDAYSCGTEISDMAILNVLAFFWAVNYYGTQIIGQKGVSVGAFAFDNCHRPDQTVENLLGFSQCKLFVRGIRENVVAYVGPYGNDDAIRTGRLASDLSITLLSPDANSYEFSDDDHKSLLRVRHNFDFDLKAILAFLKELNSEHVIFVYSDDHFYKDAHESLKEMTMNQNLCVKRDLMVSSAISDADLLQLVEDELQTQGEIRYLVPIMSGPDALKLMRAIATNQVVNDKFIYILHSDIGRNRDITTDKAVVVEPRLNVDLNVFENALQAIRRDVTQNGNFGLASLTNPWLRQYLSQSGVSEVPVLSDESKPSVLRMSVSRTIQAVSDIIRGMDNAMSDCARDSNINYQMCDNLRNPTVSRDIISDAISQAGGLTDQEPGNNVVFDYFVYWNREQKFYRIGEYNAQTMQTTMLDDPDPNVADAQEWERWFEDHFKESACPDTDGCCAPPTMSPQTGETTPSPSPSPTTDSNELLNNVVVLYPEGQEITGAFMDFTGSRDYNTRFDDGHKWVIALGVLAGLGILCVLVFEIYIMYKLLGTHMRNKWRTMWLGQLLLFGILLGYLTLVAYIWVPTDETCGITRFGVGLSYAICFAVLLVKLMVILTSKSSDVLLPGDGDSPNYLKGVYQFLMFIFAVGVQIVISVQWLITVPPEAVLVKSRAGEMVWVCNHYTWEAGKPMMVMEDFVRTNFENHLLSLVYIMVLIFITTVLSLNAHGIITNHRESVFIGIAAGFSIPIWLAWGLVGGLNYEHDEAHEFGDAAIAFGLFLTLTLILFAMFLPKVRQLVNMGVEGIYLEDDRDTYYAGSVIMAPPSYKSKNGPSSVIYVNNQGIYSEPVVIGNGDPGATHLKHPGSTYSAPPNFIKKSDSTYGGSRVLRMTDDLKGRPPHKKPSSEINYGASMRSRSSYKGTRRLSKSSSDLGAL